MREKPLSIVHVVPTYIPAWRYGGPIRSVHGLCRALARLGHDVHVFTTNVDGEKDSDVPLEKPVTIDGVKVWYFRSRLFRRLYFSRGMKQTLSTKITGFDLVHLHSVFLWPTWMAARLAQKNDIPYLIAPRGMLVKELIQRKNRWIKEIWIRIIEKKNLQKAAGIHATSRIEAEELKKFDFELPALSIVPNGIEEIPNHFAPATNTISTEDLPDHKPLILFLGRINWKKGLDRLIPAVSKVPDCHLAIVGNDEECYVPQLRELALHHGMENRISFLPPVDGDDKWALFRKTTVFVLPSYSENFGIAALEAMAAGLPVVVTPEVGLSAVINENGCGVVAEGNPDSLAASIRRVIQDGALREKMGSMGQKIVREKFTWDVIAREMASVYYKILTI